MDVGCWEIVSGWLNDLLEGWGFWMMLDVVCLWFGALRE